jgi:hypothetical protein
MITAFLKKYWPLLAVGIVLLVIAFRGCNNLPSHKEEKSSIDSLRAAYVNDSGRLVRHIADLSFQKDSLQSALDTTRRQLNSVRKDLASGVVAVRKTIANGNDAARRRDTAAILVNWDSLRAQVIAGLPIIAAQDSLSQQVIDDCLRQGAIKDSMLVAYKYLWQKADLNYGKTYDAYNSLFKDYQKANSRLNFNKTLSRGLAIALLAAGAKIFIFK